MKNYVRYIGLSIAVVFIAIVVVLSIRRVTVSETNGLTYYRMEGTFTIDYSNLSEIVGDADYVFIGEIIREEGTEYKYPIMVENSIAGKHEVTVPYTNYSISVVENIKGCLTQDKLITLQKAGGVTSDGRGCVLFEGDTMPEVGSQYIFFAYAQENGSLLISGPVSNLSMTEGETDRRAEVIAAFENQVNTERERFTSVYDVGT